MHNHAALALLAEVERFVLTALPIKKRGGSKILSLVITGIMLGVGLAMDAFSVSLANGLSLKRIDAKSVARVAGTFACFQFIMPVIGWLVVHYAAEQFEWFRGLIPWIALILLAYIGGRMIKEGIDESKSEDAAEAQSPENLSAGKLALQGIATSIDALSVGFTTVQYGFSEALLSAAIIGIVTLIICIAGVFIGHKVGMKLAWKASVLGGIILIAIGLEIWITGIWL